MIEDIIQVFEDNQNKWMTYKEVFNALNEKNFNWGPNKKGSIGHKNIVSRELSERHKSKFEVDKSFRPQKYRLKNFNNKGLEGEISTDVVISDNYREDEIKDFVLDIDNLKFEECASPNDLEIRKSPVKIKDKGIKINYDKKIKEIRKREI